MRVNERGFLLCPICVKRTDVKVIPGTTQLTKFPLYCSRCRKQFMIDYK